MPQHSWPKKQLVRPGDKPAFSWTVAGGGSEDDLFLADLANEVVRSFDVRSGRLGARDVFRCPVGEYVESVAYSARTDTLCICTWRAVKSKQIIRSFALTTTDSEPAWSEFPPFEVPTELHWGALRALSDGRLVLGSRYGSDGLRVLQVKRVGSSRAIEQDLFFALNFAHNGFDVQLVKGELLLAVAFEAKENEAEGKTVGLFHLNEATKQVKQLAVCPLRAPWMPLFCGNSLLVYARTADAGGWAVHELGIGDERLEWRRVIFDCRDPPDTDRWFERPEWCVAHDALVAWNLQHEELTIHQSILYVYAFLVSTQLLALFALL